MFRDLSWRLGHKSRGNMLGSWLTVRIEKTKQAQIQDFEISGGGGGGIFVIMQ